LFAGDEDAVMLCVVGDAVEDGFCIAEGAGGAETGEIDPREDAPVIWRDSGYAFGVPDVSVDFAFDVFELVELRNGLVSVFYDDVAGLFEGGGITEAEGRGAVAGDD
jgi:hypothetical protein